MKIRYILALFVAMFAGAAVTNAQSTYNYKFSRNSILAEGKWVRVDVDESGVYEISYEELQQMGFSDPSKVSVYGKGGRVNSTNLIQNGVVTVTDNPTQRPVWHNDGKLYFYAMGVNRVRMKDKRFYREYNNVYATSGHYYLTDGGNVSNILKENPSLSVNKYDKTICLGYDYHENDLVQGLLDMGEGQNFWGEDLAKGPFEWSPSMTAMADSRAGKIGIGIAVREGSGKTLTYTVGDTPYTYNLQGNGFMETTIAGDVDYTSGTNLKMSVPSIANCFVDHVVMSYDKDLRKIDLATFTQEMVGTATPRNSNEFGTGRFELSTDLTIWNITDPMNPTILPREEKYAYFSNVALAHDFIIFNPRKQMKKVLRWRDVSVADLHSKQNEPYSLVIVTVPELREYADEIAGLHEKHDGIKVLVTTPEECYEEFTEGIADPLAIRMLAKMLYQGGGDSKMLKNVLLFGPMRTDVRNIKGAKMPDHFIVGLQESLVKDSRRPNLLLDYFGMVSDNVPVTELISTQEMQLGVGTLHISTREEARRVVAKIRAYLEGLDSEDMAWMVNESMGVSCSGDSHTHDNSIKAVENRVKEGVSLHGGTMLHSTIMPDFYGKDMLAKLMPDRLNAGKLFSVYLGHATAYAFSGCVYAGDLMTSGSKVPGFIMLGGCEFTEPDNGGFGLGSDIVLNTPKGVAGSIASARTAWSGGNQTLAENLMRGFFSSSSATRTEIPTIGEVYATMKTLTRGDFNENVFIYIGDPALKVPVPLNSVNVNTVGTQYAYLPGDVVRISGNILSNNKDKTNFNGKVVLKLCAPTQTRYQIKYPNYSHTFSDDLITAVEAKVENGVFTAQFVLPKEASEYMTDDVQNFNVYAGAYDAASKEAASGFMALRVAARNSEPDAAAVRDEAAPEVTLTYDSALGALNVSASDNMAMVAGIGNGAGITLTIDGVPVVRDDREGMRDLGVMNYSDIIGLGMYSVGSHKVVASAVDMAGNRSEDVVLTVDIKERSSELAVVPEHIYGVDEIKFSIQGPTYEGLKFVVLNSDGDVVVEDECPGKSYVWDCSGQERGEYRVAVRCTDGRPVASSYVPVHVIE